MAFVAVSIVGSADLSAETFRRAGAALAARIEVARFGPVERDGEMAGVAAVLRTRIGPAALEAMLERLGLAERGASFHLLAYGALIYRDESLSVPPPGVANLTVALRSLAQIDPDFEIPNLGNVTSHLQRLSDRHQR